MAITFTTVAEAGIFRVRASGFDENAEEVRSYGLAVLEACRRADLTRVLCDERELEYRIGTVETYELAALMASVVPRVTRVALVCHPRGMADAEFWENVAVNRGLTVRAFADIDRAIAWLQGAPP